jgi:hypothetical protein
VLHVDSEAPRDLSHLIRLLTYMTLLTLVIAAAADDEDDDGSHCCWDYAHWTGESLIRFQMLTVYVELEGRGGEGRFH